MAALLDIPSIKNPTEFHLERWKEVCANAKLRQMPDRIETNCFGHVVMMPPPGFSHSTRQSRIIHQLHNLMPHGEICGECAVLTADGIKGLDAAWISEDRTKRGLKQDVLTIAPEICVEVASPGNTRQEIELKRELYFQAGAQEVWVCDLEGELHFFLKGAGAKEAEASSLCARMPKRIKA